MYKRYERYKDSRIEWIGKIPEHWDVVKLNYLKKKPFLYGANESPDDYDPELPRYIRITDIQSDGKLREDTQRSLTWSKASHYLLEYDDILFARSGATVGKTFIYKGINNKACFAGYLIKFSADNNKVLPQFLYYYTLCDSYNFWILINTIQATIQNVSAEKYGSLPIPLPSTYDQLCIIKYLDHKTSEIDSLIADKEKLIEKLEEYKQSIITEAVTKGLDPNVKMKDSGIEWIGEIPEHWPILSLKRLARFKSGDSISSDEIEPEGEYPVYGGNNIRGYTTSYTHDGNYILIGRQGALCGNINYASGQFWASEHAVVVYPLNNIATKWFGELLRIMDLNKYSISAAQPGISLDNIVQLPIPVPPVKEQYEIANYLNNEFYSIDSLINTVKDAINKLKQYRQSLIYEAVTGKIDVREYQTERSEQLA